VAMNEVCVIGGSRYFGKHLIQRLLAAGVGVTVLNRGSVPAPPGATHVVADRDDEAALNAALGSRRFDIVLDQVCYTSRQADIARRVFTGRTGRYVMTSTIEVYDPLSSPHLVAAAPGIPVGEGTIDLATWPVNFDLPWHDPVFRDGAYGEGKRQAEAVLSHAGFAFASVRSAHVVGGGAADFTGRLRHYADRLRTGEPVVVRKVNHASSFITDRQIAEVLLWACAADFTGPVNAAGGQLDVFAICDALAAAGAGEPSYTVAAPGGEASPYAFDRWYAMDTSRAETLGFLFTDPAQWLPEVAAEALGTVTETAGQAAA